MTVCKIILVGSNLKPACEKLLVCLRELSKNPFSVTWVIDGVSLETTGDLDLSFGIGKDTSLLTKYATVIEKILPSTKKLELTFKIPKEPPFDLVGNIHMLFRTKGLETLEMIYHSHKNQYGYQRYLQDGKIETNKKSRDRREEVDEVDRLGLPVSMEGLDLNTSSTFVEKIPKGEFANFLKEHGMDY